MNYFKKLKKQFNLTSVTIESSPKSSPTHVVTYAEEVGCKTKKYDEIYCVFDRDRHGDFDKALKMAKKLGIKTIVSDPCFEYWILLHFTQKSKEFGASGGSPCKEVQQEKEFEKNLKGYTKDYDFTNLIAKYLKDAIKNANALNKENKSQRPPYTQVVCLVEELMKQSIKLKHIEK